MYDLLITGGLLVDGKRGPGRLADVAVQDGRIAAIGDPGTLGTSATRRIDASGKVVSPGFIDIHTHLDCHLMWDPLGSPSLLHGVTTVVAGNCGIGVAPAKPENREYLMRLLSHVEQIPIESLQDGCTWDWTSYEEWFDRFDGNLGINAGFMVPHSAIRRDVMGKDAAKEATPAQITEMVSLLEQALDHGGLGLSTALAFHTDADGNPVPSRFANREELVALAAATGRHEGTQLNTTLAGTSGGFQDDEIDLITELSATARRPINYALLTIDKSKPWEWRERLDTLDRVAEGGGRVISLIFPFVSRSRFNLLTGQGLMFSHPAWSWIKNLPAEMRIAALRDPAVRDRIRRDSVDIQRERGDVPLRAPVYGDIEVAETFTPEFKALEGRTIAEIAEERGANQLDVFLDIALADDLRTEFGRVSAGETKEDWAERALGWQDHRTIVGASDAGAHLSSFCGAKYPSSVMATARDYDLMSLEETVYQLAGAPAKLYGFRGRGLIEEGGYADILVFDYDEVRPGADRTVADLPGGAKRLVADPHGIDHVFVNGVEVVDHGKVTGVKAGKLLRSGCDTRTVPLDELAL